MSSFKLFAAILVSTLMLAGSAMAHEWEDGYKGPYLLVGSSQGKQHGEIHLVLDHDGKIVGEGKNLDNGAEFKLEGVVDEDGFFKGFLEGKGFKFRLEGTLFRTKGHHLKGTLLQYLNADHSDGALTLELGGGMK